MKKPSRFGDWLHAAIQPRMLGILVLLIGGAAICIRLGAWQLDRAQERGEQAAAVEAAAREDAPPVPIADLVEPQHGFTQEMVGRRVTVTGTYVPDQQFFIEGRLHNGESGYWILSALDVPASESGFNKDAVLPVVRGWVAEADPGYLKVPTSKVQLTGYLAGSESATEALNPSLSTGSTISLVSPAQLVNIWGGPMYSGQFRIQGGPIAVPGSSLPDIAPAGPPVIADAGLNIRNLAYAGEWLVFGGFAIALWIKMLRDEVRHERDEKQKTPRAEATVSP